ncbi:hypothetical protein APHAL10511_008650 [Amanita phalloides]|nr:hypothetical protein APHAL10511_008650 [Amanita phalloides]
MQSEVSSLPHQQSTLEFTSRKPVRRPPLPEGALCTALFSRGEKVYHWSFIYPTSTKDAIKFHAVTGPDSWVYQRDDHFIARSKHACVVVQLNAPGSCTADDIDRILQTIPLKNTPGTDDEPFTCRVWMRAAAAKLHESNIINCPDVDGLAEELKELANANNQASLEGLGFTLHKSQICLL